MGEADTSNQDWNRRLPPEVYRSVQQAKALLHKHHLPAPVAAAILLEHRLRPAIERLVEAIYDVGIDEPEP